MHQILNILYMLLMLLIQSFVSKLIVSIDVFFSVIFNITLTDGANMIIFLEAQSTKSIQLKYTDGAKIQLKLYRACKGLLIDYYASFSQFPKNYKTGKVLDTSLCSDLLAQQAGQKQSLPRWRHPNTFIEMKVSHHCTPLKWKLASSIRKESALWVQYI